MASPKQITLKQLATERALREAEEYTKSFRKFVEAAWELVSPGVRFMHGMHIDAIAEHLQACSERKITKLLINMPPRAGKSTLVSVLYPAWLWTHSPAEKILSSSYALDLARRDSNWTRRVVSSKWYQERWPHVALTEDQNTKGAFENTQTGLRQITSTRGATTGLGGNHLLSDDPHNAVEAESAVYREQTIQWFRESWSTRANPGKPAVMVVVMQRLHQNDLSGFLIGAGGWDHLCLPMEYEGDAKKTTSIGWSDPRSTFGECLWPERYGDDTGTQELKDLKTSLGSTGVAGQLQQRPVPRGGGIFKEEWLCFWYDEDKGLPEPVIKQRADGSFFECRQKPMPRLDSASALNSWDLAFKGGERNDYVVGQSWGVGIKEDRGNRYLLNQIRGNYDFVQSLPFIRRLAFESGAPVILVEDKANGAAVIATLRDEIQGFVPVNPQGGKQSRASAIAPQFESGSIWLPHPKQSGHEWVDGYISELCIFPRGQHDDQVDATTQALTRLKDRQIEDIDMGSSMTANSQDNPWNV